ncbi:MAG: DUF4185 domain-containing protein [bacterium]
MPPSTVSIAKIKLLGSCFKNNSARVLGHDGAYSIPLSTGKVFWSFGDTIIGPERRGYDPRKIDLDTWLLKDSWARKNIFILSNSGLIADAKDIRELMYGGFEYLVHKRTVDGKEFIEAREIIPVPDKLKHKRKQRTAFWPVDGIEINGKLYFFYLMVTSDMFSINLYGTGMVRSTFPYKTFERLQSTSPTQLKKLADSSELPFVWWDKYQVQIPAFGTAVLKDIINNYIYVYGSKLESIGDSVIHAVSLARVKKNDIEDVNKYEYLTEPPSKQNDFTPKWGDNPQKAASIFDGNANELSVSYNPYLDKYVAIYSYAKRMNKNDEIHMRTSNSPAGPWSKPLTIYKPQGSHRKDHCYAAKEHPEYRKDLGRTFYVTYVSHQRYFPELLEIELEE